MEYTTEILRIMTVSKKRDLILCSGHSKKEQITPEVLMPKEKEINNSLHFEVLDKVEDINQNYMNT